MIDLLLAYGLAKGGTAQGDPNLPANAWDNMAPPDRSFADQQSGARGMMGDAYNASVAWGPNAQAANVNAPTIGRSDLEARKYQDDQANYLAAIAGGKGGGVAESAARQNLASSVASNNALATRANPNSLAMAMRTNTNNNAGMVQGAESQIMALRAQEQKAAQAALMATATGMRAQDFGVASDQAKMNAAAGMANAGFQTQTGLANQSADLQAQATRRAALGSASGFDMETWNAAMGKERSKRGMAAVDDEMAWNRRRRQDQAQGEVLNNFGKMATTVANNEKKY